MKESHSEDRASHAGPESCEGVREGALEALTGEPAGRAIEPRNQIIFREADLLLENIAAHEIDFTLFFRRLTGVAGGETSETIAAMFSSSKSASRKII